MGKIVCINLSRIFDPPSLSQVVAGLLSMYA